MPDSIERHDPGANYSSSVVHGDTVYLSGVTDPAEAPTVAEQTRNVLAIIDERLATAGTDRTRLLSVSIWLTDIATWAEMNSEWQAWLGEAGKPARATVEAKLAGEGLRVEIAVIAALA